MKWGKKKPSSSSSSSSSSRPFLISQVLPTSWITKFKQMNINSVQKNPKLKQKGKWNSVYTTTNSSNSGGKFYGGDGDAFWRISFGDDNLDGFKSRTVLRPVRYSSDDDLEFPPSSCQSCRSNATRVYGKEETPKFNNMVSRVRKMRGLPEKVEIFPEVQTCAREKVAEIRTPRLKVERDKILRKGNQRFFEEKRLELDGRSHDAEGIPRKVLVKNMYDMEIGRKGGMNERVDCKLAASDSRIYMNSRDFDRRKREQDGVFAAENESGRLSAENFSSERQKLKEKKIEEFKSRSEEQRKSLYISRELQRKRPKQSSKVRIYSPRTASKAEICKIKALEDMKKAKLKMKKKAKEKTIDGFKGLESKDMKKAKEKTIDGFKGLESFAVVKCSSDPQNDFRDSMIEMIKEQRISQPEELEELLACYLTLNSDEYHDLIIRVFRQVWFDLNQNQACFDTELENKNVTRINHISAHERETCNL